MLARKRMMDYNGNTLLENCINTFKLMEFVYVISERVGLSNYDIFFSKKRKKFN